MKITKLTLIIFLAFLLSSLFLLPSNDAAIKQKLSIGLYSPKNNYITTEASVIISGRVKGNLEVKINGVDAYVDESGMFSAEMPLAVGKNLIEVQGIYGKKKFALKRKVLRQQEVFISEESGLIAEKKKIADAELALYNKAVALQDLEAKEGINKDELDMIQEEKLKLVDEKANIDKWKTAFAGKEYALNKEKGNVSALATAGVLGPKEILSLDDRVVRAELAVIIIKAKEIPLEDVTEDVFADVPKDYWAAAYIKTAVDKGLMKGFPDGTFKPLSWITQKEGKEIFNNLKNLTL